MEIKKGISQMAEYPNVEINYVMPKDGRMYYVLKDGILANGCVIATTDPKFAIDETNPSNGVGVFSESGEVLIDFDKKSIKSISGELVLVVNSKLNTPEVIGIVGKEDDPMISQSVNESKETIVSKMMNEMGPSGEMLFSDSYSEANVYRLDSYNNKLGIDSSFIGKNDTSLFFHTNDINSEIKTVEVEEFQSEENIVVEDSDDTEADEKLKLDIDQDILSGFSIPEEDLEKMSDQNETTEETVVTPEEVSQETEFTEKEEENTEEVEDESEEDDIEEELPEEDTKEINLNIEPEENEETSEEEIDSSNDEVLDNAIEVIDKMIKETNKLKKKIADLEEQLLEKDKIIKESENKKDELNEILDKANEVLEKIK